MTRRFRQSSQHVGVKLQAHLDLLRIDAQREEDVLLVRRGIAQRLRERAPALEPAFEEGLRRHVAAEEDALALDATPVAQAGMLVRRRHVNHHVELREAHHDAARPREHPLLEREARPGEHVRGRALGEVGVEVGGRETYRVNFGETSS